MLYSVGYRVTALKEKLRTENIIDIIVGNETAEVTDNQYDELETYGEERMKGKKHGCQSCSKPK